MLEAAFDKVYTRFKMNFYRNLFRKVNERPGSLSATEAFSVEVIYGLHQPTIKQFAQFLKISQPNATYKVNSLMEKGYIRKIHSKQDKREYHLEVTSRFVDYYTVNDPYTKQVMQNIRSRFTQEEVRQLEWMLQVIAEELMDSALPQEGAERQASNPDTLDASNE